MYSACFIAARAGLIGAKRRSNTKKKKALDKMRRYKGTINTTISHSATRNTRPPLDLPCFRSAQRKYTLLSLPKTSAPHA